VALLVCYVGYGHLCVCSGWFHGFIFSEQWYVCWHCWFHSYL